MFLRLRLPLLLTLLAGLIPIIAFFFKDDATFIKKPNSWLEQDMVIVSGFALLLGVVNVVQSNVRKIERREKGWLFAAVLLFGMFFMGIFGAAGAMRLGGLPGIGNYPNGTPTPFAWGSVYMSTPLQSTMFSLLAFDIASAAFRAFRLRNVESGLLLGAAMLVMMGTIPLGAELSQTWLYRLQEWILSVPTVAGRRAIMMGAALGAVAIGLRVILGLERSHLGGD